jgi:hypothetical protein
VEQMQAAREAPLPVARPEHAPQIWIDEGRAAEARGEFVRLVLTVRDSHAADRIVGPLGVDARDKLFELQRLQVSIGVGHVRQPRVQHAVDFVLEHERAARDRNHNEKRRRREPHPLMRQQERAPNGHRS